MSRLAATCVFWLFCVVACAAEKPAAHVTPESAAKDPDFAVQGEYVGDIRGQRRGVQVIALGSGRFHAVGYEGGLPGDGWEKGGQTWESDGELANGAVVFANENGTGVLKDGVIRVASSSNEPVGELKKVTRASPTLGAKPPEGATVLFDGKTNDFKPGKTDGGLLVEGQNSRTKFRSATYHVEFLLPFKPAGRGQGRGNSGVYLQGRYEIQVLDSFGLGGADNECGGIYRIAAPRVNACYPPLVWQTYDIDYTAAMFEGGTKTKSARVTVKHNGVVIHDDVELPNATTSAPVKEGPEPGPLHLQDHGNPVRFRNIWAVEKR